MRARHTLRIEHGTNVGRKIGEYLGNGIIAAIETVANRIVDTLDVALDRFSRHDVESLPVVDSHATRKVVGLVSRQTLLKRYQRELESAP